MMSEVVNQAAIALRDISGLSWDERVRISRAVVESMRNVPDICYSSYRCDKMWRDLDSVQVWNLWLDAALK